MRQAGDGVQVKMGLGAGHIDQIGVGVKSREKGIAVEWGVDVRVVFCFGAGKKEYK